MLTSSAEQHFKFKKVDHGLFCFFILYSIQPWGGHVNPLQDSCLENPLDRGAWWSIVHRVAKNRDQSDLADTQAYGSAQYLVSGTQ